MCVCVCVCVYVCVCVFGEGVTLLRCLQFLLGGGYTGKDPDFLYIKNCLLPLHIFFEKMTRSELQNILLFLNDPLDLVQLFLIGFRGDLE